MKNHLKDQTSPYLLQHANNPVNWYPWCEEAFEKAKKEDKPVFLSIGYSTCHWCHVMAHESFEDKRIADILNQHFVAVKVDKEERPDIDSIYMSVCQAFTGSGGWPTTIFLTPDQKPFFAGTYFPKTAKYGQVGLETLLLTIQKKWKTDREILVKSGEDIISYLKKQNGTGKNVDEKLPDMAFSIYQKTFDVRNGGFGLAPKFPTPHNLFFLMRYYEKTKKEQGIDMVEKTLLQMYRGGIFDHIGGGFCRYSTDDKFLVPHFEKMLYDNGLLISVYSKAYQVTQNEIYRKVAQKTADYVLRELTGPKGGFYSAQDADSEGVEGKYYLFTPWEIRKILGNNAGREFNSYYDITEKGNFEGKNIPNLLKNQILDEKMEEFLPSVYEYRKKRYALHLDDKILTSWNGLMIAAMCHLYRVSGKEIYLKEAIKAQNFIEQNLCENDSLYVSYRNGKCSQKGFLDDYANEIYALLALYQATFERMYLKKAQQFCQKVIEDFYDPDLGGCYLYGKDNEQLILRPKETYDGAVFSGNSAMAYNFVQLYLITGENTYQELAQRQLAFMSREAEHYPAGYSMFLVALSDYIDPPQKITIVPADPTEMKNLPCKIPLDTVLHVVEKGSRVFPLMNNKTTYYVCKEHTCLPPENEFR